MQRHSNTLPITLLDLSPYIRRILKDKDIIPTLKSKSLVLLGRPGWGKSPLLQVLAMAVSKYWISQPDITTKLDSPCFRVAESLAVFRGEPGLIECPDIFDDGDVNLQTITSLKAFLGQIRIEGMIFARWGASKFQKHQLRALADNKFDADVEPEIHERINDGTAIKQEHFVDMLRPAFPKGISLSDIDALLKRETWMVNTKTSVYIRIAGVTSTVRRIPNECPALTNTPIK